MTERFDVAVVGLGAMGSATVAELAAIGLRVVGLDRYRPPHLFGSSHGGTRIIREAYFENPMYVPLIKRAYEAWGELERRSGVELWRRTGGLMIGPRDGLLVAGALASTEAHGLPHELLNAEELQRRFPVFEPEPQVVGVWEPRAGILFPERAVELRLREAQAAGAELWFEQPVLGWRADGDAFQLDTAAGEVIAERLVFTAGPWLGELVGGLPLEVERVVQHWFSTRPGSPLLDASRLPIFLWEFEAEKIFYGFPDVGEGAKISLHYQGEPTTASAVRREVAAAEVGRLRGLMEKHLPSANGALLRSEVCLYTKTPDLHFLIDRHPEHDRIWLVSPCSGHGFKFAPVLGRAIAAEVAGETSDVDLGAFALERRKAASAEV